MAFVKHGAAVPAKMVDMASLINSIGPGSRVKLGARAGTVSSVSGTKASLVFDEDQAEVEASLSSLTRI